MGGRGGERDFPYKTKNYLFCYRSGIIADPMSGNSEDWSAKQQKKDRIHIMQASAMEEDRCEI